MSGGEDVQGELLVLSELGIPHLDQMLGNPKWQLYFMPDSIGSQNSVDDSCFRKVS